MGADLILAIAVMPGEYNIPSSITDKEVDMWRDAYRDALYSLDAATTFEILEEFQGDLYFEDDDAITRNKEYFRLKSARESLWDVIDETIVSYQNMPRDAAYYRVGNRWALITGGLSWGDSPSDSWDAVNLLSTIWYCARGE